MRRISIVSIVEGKGEAQAVPILLRRLVAEIAPTLYTIDFPRPLLVPRDTMIKPGGLEPYVDIAAEKGDGPCAILILLDADDACPATLGPQLLKRAQAARSDRLISVVVANREYEAWFLAAAESLRGLRDLPSTLEPPNNPETIRDAKGWLQKQMPYNRKYNEPVDQPELTRHFNLEAARACDSFDKLWRDMERLLTELNPPVPTPEISPAQD